MSLYSHIPAGWSVRGSESGSMTRELFEDWETYFVSSMDRIGYGKRHSCPLILLIDGHSSRWTHHGPKTLIDAGIFPFFIASHTSAWTQPNDCGLNAMYKAQFRAAVKRWRLTFPYSVFDRIAFNKCCVEAILAVQMKLTTQLATWRASNSAWVKAGSPPPLKPKMKQGNGSLLES